MSPPVHHHVYSKVHYFLYGKEFHTFLLSWEIGSLPQALRPANKDTMATTFSSISLYLSNFFSLCLKVPKCEILMSWILMIFFYHEVYIGRGLEGGNKIFTFFTDG